MPTAGVPAATSGRAYVIPQKRKRPDDELETDEHFPYDLQERRKRIVAILENTTDFDDGMSKIRDGPLHVSWKKYKNAMHGLRDLTQESFIQIRNHRKEIASQNQQRVSDLEEQLAAKDAQMAAKDAQLTAKDAQLSHRIAELDEFYEKHIKSQLQVQIRDDKIGEQNAKITKQASDLREMATKNQHKAAKLEQSSVTHQLLTHENAALQARNEELQRSLLTQQITIQLASALFPRQQIMERLEKLERKCSCLKDPDEE